MFGSREAELEKRIARLEAAVGDIEKASMIHSKTIGKICEAIGKLWNYRRGDAKSIELLTHGLLRLRTFNENMHGGKINLFGDLHGSVRKKAGSCGNVIQFRHISKKPSNDPGGAA